MQSAESVRKEQQAKAMIETLQKYTGRIDALVTSIPQSKTSNNDNKGQVVLLTGPTGSIGSYILSALLEQPDVTHIYCLNRAYDSDALQKQRNSA